jgi:PhzF family phenazine biosynthesis protein
LRVFQVDSFTDKVFSGNPAAVCLLETAAPDDWMQSVAREMNLSETAFVASASDGLGPAFHLRWFTPRSEVELCGHATLATAHVLWETGTLDHDTAASFQTLSGVLTARKIGAEIELDFPSRVPSVAGSPPGLEEAMGVAPVSVAAVERDYLIELATEREVRGASPDFARLESLNVEATIITSLSSSDDYDFVSRFFSPKMGVNEDPVTGAAHCVLAPYWCERLGRHELVGYQASSRGGTVRVRLVADRVRLAGKAVTVMEGELVSAPPAEHGSQSAA